MEDALSASDAESPTPEHRLDDLIVLATSMIEARRRKRRHIETVYVNPQYLGE